ncbi:hypothetical protein [Neptunicella sp. SCSIO 80796]|uniref:hypothetical protein n=1 Tax=Neptunicella plasticusilytica TaxID=3117012 RepID=UPI003A4DD539
MHRNTIIILGLLLLIAISLTARMLSNSQTESDFALSPFMDDATTNKGHNSSVNTPQQQSSAATQNTDSASEFNKNSLLAEQQDSATDNQSNKDQWSIDRLTSESSSLLNNNQQQFDNETRDEQWASATELKIRDFVAIHATNPDFKLDSLECRRTLCKLLMSEPSLGKASDTQWMEMNTQLIIYRKDYGLMPAGSSSYFQGSIAEHTVFLKRI